MRAAAVFCLILPTFAAGLKFRTQEIANSLGVVYAVTTADVNSDGKPDIVAITPTQVQWYENPTWARHVILNGVTKKDNVCIAPADIDRDGKVDFALGADWQPTNTSSGGSLQWIRRDPSNPAGNWSMTPIAEEPTLHRIRWGDLDGDGKPELVVAPLHGRGTKGPKWAGKGARILVFHIPANPAKDPWPVEVADESQHIVHNFLVMNREIWTASSEGVFVLHRHLSGKWTKRAIGEGSPGEIKVTGTRGSRVLATVEPWHGNSVIIYDEQAGFWKRSTLSSSFTQAHALGWGDFTGDGKAELVVGWRGKPFGVAVFQRRSYRDWKRVDIDNGMAAEDLMVVDLNGDRKPEIVAGGRATENLRIYWQE